MKTFNRKINIALNLMQYLYLAGGDTVSCEEMSMALHESQAHCDQVLATLRKKGYVTSRRGAGGGYALNVTVPLVSVSQFLEDFDKGFATPVGVNSLLASERLSVCLEDYADRLQLEELFIGLPELTDTTLRSTS